MKYTSGYFLLFIAFISFPSLHAQREVENISDNWKFGNGAVNQVINVDYNDDGWQTINLPHTWNGFDGQDGGDNLVKGRRWYRKKLQPQESWQGKKIFIRFGSAFLKSDVYVNEQLVGTHIGGYAAFIFDITKFIRLDSVNQVAVWVDNSSGIDAAPLSGDFTFFGGITRDVELIATDSIFISPLDYASPGVYLTPYNISSEQASLNIKVLVGNHSSENKDVDVVAYVKDRDGILIDSVQTIVNVKLDTILTASMDLDVMSPILWDATRNPYLYSVEVNLKTDNVITDKVTQPLGFRTFSVDADTGFVLNGKKYDLHGVCLHEDRADIGRAISDENRKEDLDIMQDLGCTYIRLVHSQHGEFTYDYCDSIGMVLSTEVPLVNKISSTAAFAENSKAQLNELIKQNYNHPSVMFWGMFNEINFHAGPNPASLIGQLNTLSHQLDSTRLTTGAAQNDEAETHWLLDVCGWNKYMGWYDGSFEDYAAWADWLHGKYPDTKISMSEYGAGASIHHHQEASIRPNPGGLFHPEEYQADYHEAYYKAMLERPFIWSTAVWVAFDFASDYRNEGDAPGINDKGLVTRDRQTKKDAYFYYKAHWSDEPFAYITSRRFTERTSENTKVKVYSNCDSVKLFVNDQPFPTITSDTRIFTWADVTLNEGENTIRVDGFSSGNTFSDSCVWNFTKSANDTLLAGDIQINFQTATSTTPQGYLPDDGAAFGDRGNGYSYGWIPENIANTRERTSTENAVFNTFNHIQKNDISYTWEMEVENGIYQVSIGCGDPDFTDSYHKILVEGQLMVEGYNAATSMKVATDTITVIDGKLTVNPAPGASNAKINLIHITKLSSIEDAGLGIQNGSFELPETNLKFRADGNGNGGPFNTNVPGWWAEPGTTDCGRQDTGKPAYDGTYTGYAYNNDNGSIWALAGTIKENQNVLDLSFYAWESYPKGQSGVNIVAKFAVYEGTDPAQYSILETMSIPFSSVSHDANGWGHFTYTYTLPKSVEGKNMLIGFDIVTSNTGDSWFSFDNFTLKASIDTEVESVTDSKNMEVYPNPAHNFIWVKSQITSNGTFNLYNLAGGKMLSGDITSQHQKIDVSQLEKGVYLLEVITAEGAKIIKTVLE